MLLSRKTLYMRRTGYYIYNYLVIYFTDPWFDETNIFDLSGK